MDAGQADAARQAGLEQYDVLGKPPSRDLQALVELAAQVCDVPTAAINMITATEQHQVAAAGFDRSICAREDSMCAAVLGEPLPVVVADASADPRFADNPFVTGSLGQVRFYASAPLVTPAGVTVGRLCVFDDEPRVLSVRQHGALLALADRVLDVLELRLRSHQLERSLAELTAARDELKRSNEHLSLFAGQVSHDLRTPLTAILANAEMLSMEPTVVEDEDLAWMVSGIDRAGHRMAAMLEDILAYARVGGDLQSRDTDLGEVVAEVLSDLAPVLDARRADVTVKDLPVVHADTHQLYSVLLNLLANAVKFTADDVVPQVTVAAERRDDVWRVAVTDNGIGVAAERREDMFVLFSRADKRVDGSGIGLATARRVVEAHGGRIGMQAADPQGTTVWFELPA
ncbi:GAF domain-containing sensor histidine kinase [Nocardioides sp. WL0053]|uniref:Sensor-like histidine kinase SenX3 n=1 Tax=Nocardioides jiangsuensis TaxID=2866161 RepID=A0ABS7RPU5_9ACTN|nr:GAF domain-containing sensor histidine kinase [Nocardioides jiangsuensis]MBY9076073.1 GAF domain-containing sensor histidine kinase [Nocardioides jiangsuensis]